MSFLDKDILIARNPYNVLGLTELATIENIRESYRKLVLEWHPDRNKDEGSAEVFIKVKWAYDILSNPKRREMFDKYGSVEEGEESLEENLEKFNQDIQDDLNELRAKNFKDSIQKYRPQRICDDCDGLGFKKEQEGFFITERECRVCRGTGYVEIIIKQDLPPIIFR